MTKFTPPPKTSGNFIGAEERKTLIADATALPVKAVSKGPSRFEKDQETYTVTVELDGEERSISWAAGTVFSRDAFLDSLAEHLTAEDAESVSVIITLDGKAQILEVAE